MLQPLRAFTPIAVLMAACVAPAALAGPVIRCTAPGVPVGCVANPAVRAATPGAGAPGVGVRPAAGPGVGPNTGGPVNRAGRR